MSASAVIRAVDAPAHAADVRQQDAFAALGELPRESVHLICTSPPYWGHRVYDEDPDENVLQLWRDETHDPQRQPGYEWFRRNGGMLGLEPFPEWYVEHVAEILSRGHDALRPDGSLWVNLGDTYFARWSSIRPHGRQGLAGPQRSRRRTPSGGWRHDKQLLMLPARFAIAMQERGWILRNDVIWAKTQVGPRPERDRLRLSHEHFFHFVRRQKGGRPRYWYDLAAAEAGGTDVVIHAISRENHGHPATFPKSLVRPRVLSSCPLGGLVVDPFCGAGTTLQVAIETGRRALGFDISQAYVNVARQRIGLSLDGCVAL